MANFERTYKGVRIVVVTGDITQQEVDAIVNPANSMLIMGGGAAGAIKRVGGKEIEDEAVKHAPVPVGEAIATGAGRLKAKYVIHAPTMEKPAMRIDERNVKLSMRGALKCADCLGIRNVAFPGMGTGVGGLGLKDAARVMTKEVKEHIDEHTTLKQVVFVGFRADLTCAFEEAVNEIL
ncbi:MAG: macro domain-containing protein [Candidatus Bathyarchaeia archaeon]